VTTVARRRKKRRKSNEFLSLETPILQSETQVEMCNERIANQEKVITAMPICPNEQRAISYTYALTFVRSAGREFTLVRHPARCANAAGEIRTSNEYVKQCFNSDSINCG
jgi:hypothetical protein